MNRQIRTIKIEIASLIDQDPLWEKLDTAFRGIKGVADRTVAGLMAHMPEIGLALERPENKTTLIAFCQEGAGMAECLSRRRMGPWGKKVFFIATEKGLYAGREGLLHPSPSGGERDWWTFGEVTHLLRNGAGGCP